MADMLEIKLDKAYVLAWSLDRRFIGPSGKHIRVTLSSVEHFLALSESGLAYEAARRECWAKYATDDQRYSANYGHNFRWNRQLRSGPVDFGQTSRSRSYWARKAWN